MYEEKHSKKSNAGKILGAGVLGVIAGIAAGIFLAPKNGKKNRDEFKAWADDTQEQILEKIREVKDLTEEKYDEIVDEVVSKKGVTQEITQEEWEDFAKDLKKRWKRVKDRLNKEYKK